MIFIIILLIPTAVNCEQSNTVQLYPFAEDGLPFYSDASHQGLIDSNGNIVIPAIYDYPTRQTSNPDYIKVHKDGKYGIIDLAGNTILDIEYSEILDPIDGYVCCLYNNDITVYDLKSNTKNVYSSKYDVVNIGGFNGNLFYFVTSQGNIGYMDAKGNIVIHPTGLYIPYMVNDQMNPMDNSFAFVNDTAVFIDGTTGLCGLVSQNGNLQLAPTYSQLRRVNDKIFIGSKKIGADTLTGVIDADGHFCFDDQDLDITNYKWESELGLIVLRKRWNDSYLYGAINESGEVVIPFNFTYISDFSNSFALAKSKEGAYGVVDSSGEYVVEPTWKLDHGVTSRNSLNNTVCINNSLFSVDGNLITGPWEYMQTSGPWNTPVQEQSLVYVEDRYGKYGYIDLEGNIVFGPISNGDGNNFAIRNGIMFGMEKDAIISIEGVPKKSNSTGKSIQYKTTAAGKEANMEMNFNEDNLLCSIIYQFSDYHINPDLYVKDYEELDTTLSEKYGKPDEQGINWTNNTYKALYSETPGTALQLGFVSYVSKWNIGDVTIIHGVIGDNLSIRHILGYSNDSLKTSDQSQNKYDGI